MSDSRFNTELDALVNGNSTSSTSELTEFAAQLYGEEQQVVMPNALKRNLAAQLGLNPAAATPATSAPISNRTARALVADKRSNRPWFICLAIAAGLILALTGVLRFGLPGGDDNDNQFLLSSPAVPTVSATPAADPGTPRAISPEECLMADTGTTSVAKSGDQEIEPNVDYVVVGPANAEDTAAANEVVRQYVACGFTDEHATGDLSLKSSFLDGGFSPQQISLYKNLLSQGENVSGQMAELGVTRDNALMVPNNESNAMLFPNPDAAMEMEDGRILIPMGAFNYGDADLFNGIVLLNDDGDWLVDDSIPLCLGNCESIFASYSQTGMDYLWLSPITSEECEGNAVLPEGLTDEETAVIHSRQYRACEMNDSGADLQGPDFAQSGSDEELSGEITSGLRQNGETAGSLQRIRMAAEDDDEFTDGWNAFPPGTVVMLADGRIAVPEATVRANDMVGTSTGRTNPVITNVLIWTVDGDEWLLDEEATICLGNCDSYWNTAGTPEAEASADALVLPETCGEAFQVDFTSHAIMPITMRPGAGMASGTSVAQLPAGTELQYLCEFEETTNPSGDRMDEGQRWLKVRTADGTEGWVREIDIVPVD